MYIKYTRSLIISKFGMYKINSNKRFKKEEERKKKFAIPLRRFQTLNI